VTNNDNDEIDYSYGGINVVVVESVPKGYILREEALEKYDGLIEMAFFESSFHIADLDYTAVVSSLINDKNLLVEYNNDIYINEEKIKEILPSAYQVVEERNKVYYIGDTIEMYAFSCPATIKVDCVSYTDNYENATVKNDEWVCIIEVDINDAFDSFDSAYRRQLIEDNRCASWRYFDHAETADGQIYKTVVKTNSTQEVPRLSQIAFILPKGEKAKYLFISCSTSHGSPTVRKVDVNES